MSKKIRRTLTLDPEIVAALGDDPNSLSATVNAILREEVERRDMHAALGKLVTRLEAEWGPADPEQVARYRELLSP